MPVLAPQLLFASLLPLTLIGGALLIGGLYSLVVKRLSTRYSAVVPLPVVPDGVTSAASDRPAAARLPSLLCGMPVALFIGFCVYAARA